MSDSIADRAGLFTVNNLRVDADHRPDPPFLGVSIREVRESVAHELARQAAEASLHAGQQPRRTAK